MTEQINMTPIYKLYQKAMETTTGQEAEDILSELIALAIQQNPQLNYGEAKAIQLSNIGYFTGYLSDRTDQRRVLALYQTEHPIFGSYDQEVTPDKAFTAGMALGAVIKEGKLTAEAIKAARQIIEQP
jgi:hypothetical protein